MMTGGLGIDATYEMTGRNEEIIRGGEELWAIG